LWRNWVEVIPYLTQLNFQELLVGEGCILVAQVLGGLTWYLLQDGYGLGFGFKESFAVQFASVITKYIPGYIWQYMSKAYISRKRGASSRQIMLAIMSEFVLIILGGVIWMGLFAGYFGVQAPVLQSIPGWLWWLVSIVCGAVIILWNRWSMRAFGFQYFPVDRKKQWLAFLVGMIGWLFFAWAFWIFIQSLYPLEWIYFPQVGFALSASVIAGILVVFVPNGVGIREASMTLLLAGLLPLSLGVVVSVMLRLGVVLGELICFTLVCRLSILKPYNSQ
jgi:hypothetical protein